jgi:hypothetical protein
VRCGWGKWNNEEQRVYMCSVEELELQGAPGLRHGGAFRIHRELGSQATPGLRANSGAAGNSYA